MVKWEEFIFQNRIYLGLLVLIFLFHILSGLVFPEGEPAETESQVVRLLQNTGERLGSKEEIARILGENKTRATVLLITGFVTLLTFFLGVVLNINFLFLKAGGRKIIMSDHGPHPAAWSVIDIGRVTVVLVFIGYLVTFVEAMAFSNASFRESGGRLVDIANSVFFDFAALAVILYFVLVKYRQKLSTLGITFRNLLRNVFLGTGGYVAILPTLFVVRIISLGIAHFTGYDTRLNPAVEIFWLEKRIWLVFSMVVFVCFVGPLVEEVFFRGFMYNALKKKWGTVPGMLLSSVFFAFLHFNVIDFFPIVVLGILLAYIYEKTGSLFSSLTVHILNNSVSVFFLFLFRNLFG